MSSSQKRRHKRRILLGLQDEDIFKNQTKLDDYLDSKYKEYTRTVTGIHGGLEEDFDWRPEITKVIKAVETELLDKDMGLYNHLDRQHFPVRNTNKYMAVTNLFARVIVSENLPTIFK